MEGIYQHQIDAKGRLSIPARLREDLGETFYVTLSMDKCLAAYSLESWKGFMEKIAAMPTASKRKMRPLFTHAAKCDVDSQGRILLTQALRDFAGLNRSVTIAGVGDHVEIWDSDAFAPVDAMETTPEYIAGVFEELGI